MKSSKDREEANKKYQLNELLTARGFEDYLIYYEDFIKYIKHIEDQYTSQNIKFPVWFEIDSREWMRLITKKTKVRYGRRNLYVVIGEILEQIGIIQIDASYLRGYAYKSYRLTEKYRLKLSPNQYTVDSKKGQSKDIVYRKLYTVSPRTEKSQASPLRGSGLPPNEWLKPSEEDEDWHKSLKSLQEISQPEAVSTQMTNEATTLQEAKEICRRLLSETLSDHIERSRTYIFPKHIDIGRPHHQPAPSVSDRSQLVVASERKKQKIGIVLDKNFTNKMILKEHIFNLKSHAEMIIGIDNRGAAHWVQKLSDYFEHDYREVLPGHYQWTTRSLFAPKEHYKKYSTLNYIIRDRMFADKVDRVMIFKDWNKQLDKNTLYVIQELKRKNIDYEIIT